jgi:hypothetical protein
MPENNKISLSFNYYVLSISIWIFGIIFIGISMLFVSSIRLLNLTSLVKSFNELASVITLSAIVFGVFTGCILLSDKLLAKFWSKLSFLHGKNQLVLSVGLLFASSVGIYFGLAWFLVFLQSMIQ